MRLTIRPADLVSDRRVIIDTLARCLTSLSDERRFEWLYISGPHGPGRAWLAIDNDRDVVAGVAAAFPRRVYFQGAETMAWVLGDFCLDPQYRSLGPALQLQRACLSIMDSGNAAFCYDFPSASMAAVYSRLGIVSAKHMVRLARPLRVDRKVRELVPVPGVQQVVSAVGNTLLKFAHSQVQTQCSLSISLHEGLCAEEFSLLAQELQDQLGACVQRSAEYLNWRYWHNPLGRYEFITARSGDRLKGYAVFEQSGDDGVLVDLFGANDEEVIKGLIERLVMLIERRGATTLSAPLIESHPWLSWFTDLGFRPRESAPLVVVPSKLPIGDGKRGRGALFFMQGDRDS